MSDSGIMTAAYTIKEMEPFTSPADVAEYLDALDAGEGTVENPAYLPLDMDLGAMPDAAQSSAWYQLLGAIEEAGVYVDLDLSGCTIGGTTTTVFNPDYTYENGKKYIVTIDLPDTAVSIQGTAGEIQNAFLYFNELTSFSGAGLKIIGDRAFQYVLDHPETHTKLNMTSLPSGITSVGGFAFQCLTTLALTSLPDGLTSIGEAAFGSSNSDLNATAITISSLPEGFTTFVGNRQFRNCKGITEMTLPASLGSFNNITFDGCSNLQTVYCLRETPLTLLGTGVFDNTHPDLIIYVPADSVTAYQTATNWSAYADKIQAIPTPPAITTASLPDGKADRAYSATLAASGTAPVTWTREGGSLPAGLTLSTAGVISGTPTAAGTANFTVKAANSKGSDTKALSIIINEGGGTLESIEDVTAYLAAAAGGATPGNPVDLPLEMDLGAMPDAAKSSAWYQLLDAIEAAGLYVELDLSACTINVTGTVFDPDWTYPDGKEYIVTIALPDTAVSIPDAAAGNQNAFLYFKELTSFSGKGLKTIGHRAFQYSMATPPNENARTKLNMTSLPSGITTIGNYAFQYLPTLALESLPDGLTSISVGCFGGGLAGVGAAITISSLPEGITSIGDEAFRNCTDITEMMLPTTVTNIRPAAFSNCPNLQTVTCLATTPPTLGTGVFDNTHPDLVIYVPADRVVAYKTATNWSAYAGRITAKADPNDATAPALSAGSVDRTGNTAAAISFTTDEAGTAYCLVQNSGDAAPTKEQVKAGTSLGAVNSGASTGMAVTLTGGAKDIYVVVEDYSGNISATLKITAEAFDTTAPVVTNGKADRVSDTAASIRFTTDEEGIVYFQAVNSGYAAPAKEAIVSGGTSLGAATVGVNSKTATPLTSGAKDIYVVVMDEAENISEPVKLVAPAYIASTSYTITKVSNEYVSAGGNEIRDEKIQNVIDIIKTRTNGTACTIQFGNGTAVLDIGTDYVSFSDTWGPITLKGKITSAVTTPGTLPVASTEYGTITIGSRDVPAAVAITSTADITNTASVAMSGGDAIFYNSTGALNISGGTVKATGGSAIYHYGTGKLTVSGTGTLITTAVNVTYRAAIILPNSYETSLGTRLEIAGGTVENTAASSGYAVYNASVGTIDITSGSTVSTIAGTAISLSNGALNITGGTVKAESFGSTRGTAVSHGSTGAINISGGGTVSATTGMAISSIGRGKITVSGGSVTSANIDNGRGTIYFSSSAGTDTVLEVKGGTVRNTGGTSAIYNSAVGAIDISAGTVSAVDGAAIYSQSTGMVTVSGTADITSKANPNDPNFKGTIYLRYGAPLTALRLKISGGTVKNTYTTLTTGHAVYNDNGPEAIDIDMSCITQGTVYQRP
jgi:hypothetical protein